MAIEDNRFNHEKQPSEEYPIGVKFGNRLSSGITISSVTVTEIDLGTGLAPTSTILNGLYQIGTLADDDITFTEGVGTVVSQKIKAGVDTGRYKISLVAIDSATNKHEADIILTVTDL
jgi:hypothetical protein